MRTYVYTERERAAAAVKADPIFKISLKSAYGTLPFPSRRSHQVWVGEREGNTFRPHTG